MKHGALSLWVYLAAALLIALVAFGIGQVRPGLGVVFAAFATTLWTAWSVNRQREWLKKNG